MVKQYSQWLLQFRKNKLKLNAQVGTELNTILKNY